MQKNYIKEQNFLKYPAKTKLMMDISDVDISDVELLSFLITVDRFKTLNQFLFC